MCGAIPAFRLGANGHWRFQKQVIDAIVIGDIKMQMSKPRIVTHQVWLKAPHTERKLKALLAYKTKGDTRNGFQKG